MRAIVATPPDRNSVQLMELRKPKPKENEALLRILKVGIDTADREINDGYYGTPPEGSPFIIIGHEAVGIVEEVGENVKNVKVGDVVVPMVRRPCIQNCLNCKSGEPDACITGNYLEHGIIKLHGFASDYTVTDAQYLIKVPEDLKDEAVFLEPLSRVEKGISQLIKIQERLIWEPQDVLVTGAGPLGLLATLVLRLRGFDVLNVSRNRVESIKAKIVREAGGKYLDERENPLSSLDRKFDIIVEASGAASTALECCGLLKPNGILCFLGLYREIQECDDFGRIFANMVVGNKVAFGSVSSNRKHYEMGLKDLIDIKNKYPKIMDKLVSRELTPEKANLAFKSDFEEIKTIINFQK
ncbi:MAG: glucose 1-dehydrogenase [Candidatus Freyarchaeota archaeon]|nr:glucose 1-dehydrogenase [Candidatus Jordarchaeia archaeon]